MHSLCTNFDVNAKNVPVIHFFFSFTFMDAVVILCQTGIVQITEFYSLRELSVLSKNTVWVH